MERYISVDKLENYLRSSIGDYSQVYGENDPFVKGVESVLAAVEATPSADVEKVVRCKDCKRRFKNLGCPHSLAALNDDHFCGYGTNMDV